MFIFIAFKILILKDAYKIEILIKKIVTFNLEVLTHFGHYLKQGESGKCRLICIFL